MVMKLLRSVYTRQIFTFVAGITFLNMSFFLAEVVAFNIDKNSQLVQNFLNTGIEEEKETGEATGESDESVKELDLSIAEHLFHHKILFELGKKRNSILDNLTVEAGYLKKFSPPPERHITT